MLLDHVSTLSATSCRPGSRCYDGVCHRSRSQVVVRECGVECAASPTKASRTTQHITALKTSNSGRLSSTDRRPVGRPHYKLPVGVKCARINERIAWRTALKVAHSIAAEEPQIATYCRLTGSMRPT